MRSPEFDQKKCCGTDVHISLPVHPLILHMAVLLAYHISITGLTEGQGTKTNPFSSAPYDYNKQDQNRHQIALKQLSSVSVKNHNAKVKCLKVHLSSNSMNYSSFCRKNICQEWYINITCTMQNIDYESVTQDYNTFQMLKLLKYRVISKLLVYRY